VWRKLVPSLAERFRVIVPDLRGHGWSGGEPETIHHDRFAEDLVALLDHLGLERAHFVGHSSGGMSLLHVGTRHPTRALSLTLANATYAFDARAKVSIYGRECTGDSGEGIPQVCGEDAPPGCRRIG
jgi:pimeloyl-ACP methyl ester carboxylesterase